jgi:two-component SAPR family response regulator
MGRLCGAAIAADIEVEYTVDLIRAHDLAPVYERPEHLNKWPWPCHIRTFGGLEVRVNNESWSTNGSRRPLDLLKVLIAFGGDKVRQELIEDELWPQSEGDTAHIAFKTNMSRLRKIVGEKTILVKDGKVSLNPACVWLDIWALESLAGAVSDYAKRDLSGSPDGIEGLAGLVFDIYRGEFLASEDEPWIDRAREKFSRQLVRTIDKMIEMFDTMGKHKTAERLFKRATEIGIPEGSIRFRSR